MRTPILRRHRRSLSALALVLLAAAGLNWALPALAQGSGSPAASPAPAAGSARSSKAAEEEREMVEDLAHAHLAEVEASRLALDKTQNAQVRSFAQQMVDEHTQAYQALQQLGQKKQMAVPSETDFQHKALATALRLLSGDTFNRQYIRQVGINDHRRTVDVLMKLQQTSADADLKAYAAKSLPLVERHLAQARELDQRLR